MTLSTMTAWPRSIVTITFVGVSLAAASTMLGSAPPVVMALFAVGAMTVLSAGQARLARTRRFGLANTLTLLRIAAACLLAGIAVADAGIGWSAFMIALAGLSLDALDGPVARYTRRSSSFGARFDMDADTAFLASLVLCLIAADRAGAWLAALAFLRPAFVLAGLTWRRLAQPLPPSARRRASCGTAALALVVALAPPLAGAAPWLAAGALAILVLSFVIDLAWLMRGRTAIAA